MKRSAKMDNFRGILMVLVVLGHLLELRRGGLTDYLYYCIYSFHMPLFVWISGYFAKPADRSCLKTLVLPYLCFQCAYLILNIYVYRTEEAVKLLEPYWLMWFIMALLIWRLLLPLVDTRNRKQQALVLGVALGLAILTGWEDELRYVLSFQRMTALFPMFLLGYYGRGWAGDISRWWHGRTEQERRLMRIALWLLVLIGLMGLYILQPVLLRRWFYWKYPYGRRGGSEITRSLLLLYAVVCLGAALTVLPKKRIRFLTRLGRRTLPVYLLHGFVIELLDHFGVMGKVHFPLVVTGVLAAAMLWVFASDPVYRLFTACFGKRK